MRTGALYECVNINATSRKSQNDVSQFLSHNNRLKERGFLIFHSSKEQDVFAQ